LIFFKNRAIPVLQIADSLDQHCCQRRALPQFGYLLLVRPVLMLDKETKF
jgi:hypothetical protein